MADLGLAYLTVGDEAKGLHWLHEAQQAFTARNEQTLLRQCRENEVRYLEHVGKRDAAAQVRAHLQASP